MGLLVPGWPGLPPHRGAFCVGKVSWGRPGEIGGLQVSFSSSSSLSVVAQDRSRLRGDYISDADSEKRKGNVILLPGG